jgi:hypothetical protein
LKRTYFLSYKLVLLYNFLYIPSLGEMIRNDVEKVIDIRKPYSECKTTFFNIYTTDVFR